MRVYLSVDMEGIAGVMHPATTERGELGYERALALMTAETNAAIEGAVAGGATDILVNDSHGYMHNLAPAQLHPAARLLQGQKPWSMVSGAGAETHGAGAEPAVDPLWDVALLVGYHARAGHPRGTLAHSYDYRQTRSAIGGRATGEYGLNAAVLGAWGIPVGLVTGDDALAAEVADWLPWAERVVVKTAVGGNAAASLHPTRACDLVRAGAERAVRRAAAGELRLLEVARPVVVEVEFERAVLADHAAVIPGVERVGDRGIRIAAADPVTAYRTYLAAFRLSTIVV